ncbi:MAG TPA: hypothetical protein DHW61_04220 [Lachnoclostridium phytofermentans]|uniref:Uncharacterized protein n=1 Tax=Lachnoclostridium phytofermentans TaxID=66219 RepID=A0A3D2X395_9FIRM|nr:hypothetical protein [Lachnoclostridium phytofermentans]
MIKKIKIIIAVFFLIIFLSLIVLGHNTIGYTGLGQMMIGLIGILILLFIYNKGANSGGN